MKTFLYSAVIFIVLLPILNYVAFILHTEKTEYGECVGVGQTKEPHLVYEINKKNVFISVIFFDSIVTPTVIIINNLYCPIGKK